MTFRTLLTVTGPNQGEGDLKLAADLCEQIGAHLSVLVLEIAAPPSGGEYAAGQIDTLQKHLEAAKSLKPGS